MTGVTDVLAVAGGVLAFMLAVMTAAWLFQRAVANGGWTDVFWTYGSGLACAAAALVPLDGGGVEAAAPWWRRALVAAMALAWALRLGTYVARRVAGGPEDTRYALLRKTWGARFQPRMFGLLIVQAPVTALLSLAVIYAAHRPAPGLLATDLAGPLILALAVAGEALADRQMHRFRRDPANRGRICRDGLWGRSRHPNYFFEIAGWLAYPVMGLSLADPWSALSLAAPVAMYLVIRYGSGIPPLEAAMIETRGDAYRAYQREVPALIPRP